MDRKTYRDLAQSFDYDPGYRTGFMITFFVVLELCLFLWLSLSGSTIAYVIGQAGLAVALHHCFLIVHECTHESFIRGKKLNLGVGILFSIPALLPFWSRRIEHLAHHTYTGNLDHDGATKRGIEKFPRHGTIRQYFLLGCWKTGVPIFSIIEHCNLWKMVFRVEQRLRPRQRALLIASGMISFGALMTFAFLLGWSTLCLLPAVFGYLVLIEFFNLPHHFDSELYAGEAKPIWEQHHLTKSCEMHPWLAKVLLFNFNYHIEHHFFPQLPWQNLPEAQTKVKAVLCDEYQTTQEIQWHLLHRGKPFREAFHKYLDHQVAVDGMLKEQERPGPSYERVS